MRFANGPSANLVLFFGGNRHPSPNNKRAPVVPPFASR